MDYFGARYYLAAVGRWGSVDPSDAADRMAEWSTYQYAKGDPTGMVDRQGRCPKAFGGDGKTKTSSDCPPGSAGRNRYTSGAVEPAPLDPTVFFGGWTSVAARTGEGLLAKVAQLLASMFERKVVATAAADATSVVATRGGAEMVSLYRVVGDAELQIIESSGGRIAASLSGLEVKYFSATPEGAASYAKQAVSRFGDAPYTLVETQIARSSLHTQVARQVDRNVPAVALPNMFLSTLTPAKIWTLMPIP